MKRYYFKRHRDTGVYMVIDRSIHDQVIATCLYKEQAELVTEALNGQDRALLPLPKFHIEETLK